MSAPGGFSQARVAILGMGLMGGSLALALDGICARLCVYDPNPETISLARTLQIGQVQTTLIADACRDADILILAAPISGIIETLARLPELHPGSPVVLDIGSTKQDICAAMDRLPERIQAVGGHPMAGLAAAGLGAAKKDLFQGAAFAFVPTSRTTHRARAIAGELAGILGANPLWLDAATHDVWVASTSHLPYLLSLALVLATPEEAAPLAGPGFASTSRLAGSSSGMMLDILMTNSKNIQAALDRFVAALQELQAGIQSGDQAGLAHRMSAGARKRAGLVNPSGGSVQ